MYPEELRYTKTHEWVKVTGTLARIGITAFAAEELGAVVGVDLPRPGKELKCGEPLADLDSMKTAEQIFAPVSGRVLDVNGDLKTAPELINDDPYGEGWIAAIEMSDPSELERLMDAGRYAAFVEEVRDKK